MKKLLLFFISIVSISWCFAQGLAGGHDYQLYYSPEGKPYIENYFWISGPSLTYAQSNDKKKAAIEIVVMFSKNGKVNAYDKYVIESLEYDLNDSNYRDLMDLRRYEIPDGNVEFELFITDLNAKNRYIEKKDTIQEIPHDQKTSFFSSIEFVEMYSKTKEKNNYSKSGYDILPYVGALYEEAVNKLVFYAELYQTDKNFGNNAKYLLSYYLENLESGRQLENFTVKKREISSSIKPILAEFNIQNLAAGNYNLVIELRDSTNKFVNKTSRIFRRENSQYVMKEEEFANLNIENTFVNSIKNNDSLEYFIKILKPISSEIEYQYGKNVMKNGDPTLMKRYLLSFWIKRNNNSPFEDFKAYNEIVKLVHEKYGNPVTPGYNSDRGRIFLKYGPPNTVSTRYNEANTYPYEIWQYYKLSGQNNVRFVFYNKDMVSDDFTLLHSDLRGEINNRQWEMFLRQRSTVFDIDQNSPNDPNGNWSNDLYNQPR